jgi:hypothetical protein
VNLLLLLLLLLLPCLLSCSAYGDKSCLSPQLLASFTEHLEERGSRDVLLDVFTNSTGPLPQDLLPLNTVVSTSAVDTDCEPLIGSQSWFSI